MQSIKWDKSLTEKLRYLLMIKPLVELKDLRKNDPKLKSQFYHYDPLAISLKLLEIIISNMTIIYASSYTSGTTREELFHEIEPFLSLIDNEKSIFLTRDEHFLFFQTLLDKLISPGSKIHQELYTDYSSNPPAQKRLDFTILYYETSPDDVVEIFVDSKMINVFANILDMKLEDRQRAMLFVLNEQIKRGALQNAVETVKSYLQQSLVFFEKIKNMINITKRQYNNADWEDEFPSKLKEAERHIKYCAKTQIAHQNELVARYNDVQDISTKEYALLAELKNHINKSLNVLLPLRGKIVQASETFMHEQLQQGFNFHQVNSVDLEVITQKISVEPVKNNNFILDLIAQYFSNLKVPHVNSLSNSIKLLLRKTEGSGLRKKVKSEKRNRNLIGSEPYFTDSTKSSAIEYLLKILVKNPKVALADILREMSAMGATKDEKLYICLVVQGRYAIENFESKVLEMKINLDLSEHFEFENFKGTGLIISKV